MQSYDFSIMFYDCYFWCIGSFLWYIKINDVYSKVVEYYKNNNTLNNADKILAVESLGLEAESNQFDISSVDFSKTSLSKKL